MQADQQVVEAAELLGRPVQTWRALSGGDLSAVLHLDFSDGGAAVVKTGPKPTAEAAMLTAIRAAGAAAPRVLAVSDRVLVLEALPEGGGPDPSGWAALGHDLARLHGATGSRYGWAEDFAFGAVAIPNDWTDNWAEFWAKRRLLPECASLPPAFARRLEVLAVALPDRLPAHPPAALLHGDLWAGNVLAAQGRYSGLIDPACYYGHAEVDFAMLHLFGSPAPALQAAYGPGEPGAADRRAIYQIWPAIVHVRLFGAGYHRMLDGLLTQAGA